MVTPPESKAMLINSCGVKYNNIIIIIKLIVTIVRNDNLLRIRKTPINKYTPTPNATKPINKIFGIDDNSLAKTIKSGSEIVITIPTIKLANKIIAFFLFLTNKLPIFSPI